MDQISAIYLLPTAAVCALVTWFLAMARWRAKSTVERQSWSLDRAALEHEARGALSQLGDAKAERDALKAANAELQEQLAVRREEVSDLRARLEAQAKGTEEKLALLTDAKSKLTLEFKDLANRIFDEKEKRFTDVSRQQLGSLLQPLGEKIRDFEKKVSESYASESRERYSLAQEVKRLQELNTRISEDAVNLTNALKGQNKTQGTWGEVILERVLEKSGLVRGREYEIQKSYRDEEGKRGQPDVIVHLPEGKDVVIDSKMSLKAYERFASADDETTRADALRQHIASLRAHIKELARKDYQQLEGVRSLDFVLMFVPVEAAFGVAVEREADLFGEAFELNIVLVSPSTLLATLRTIQNIWRFEYQNKNAQAIASKAGALYDKFTSFAGDLEDVGKKIQATQESFERAHKKLASGRGNLVRRAEELKGLGANASKHLPESLVEGAAASDTDTRIKVVPAADPPAPKQDAV